MQELLKLLGGDEPGEHAPRRFCGQIGVVEARLDPLLQPVALILVGDVHVFDANGAAIRGFELAQQPL